MARTDETTVLAFSNVLITLRVMNGIARGITNGIARGTSNYITRSVMSTSFAMLLLASAPGCAAYHVGNRSLYPADVETVYVPVFQSSSFRRDLGERLTEAVIKEIERRTPFKVVGTPNADTMLTCKIVGDMKHLLFQTRNDDPREMEVDLHVQVNWTDRRGNTLRESHGIAVPPECVSMTGTSEVVPEVGQSIATAQQEAIVRLSRQIVSLMEIPW